MNDREALREIEERIRFERYDALLNGEMIGVVLGVGLFAVCAGWIMFGVPAIGIALAAHLLGRWGARRGRCNNRAHNLT
jgi:hypothetical protein